MNCSDLSASLKDYLHGIYRIQMKEGMVRVTEIAVALQVSKPSVCTAIQQLEKYGLVVHECYQPLYLTDQGLLLGRQLEEEFKSVQFLLSDVLGINEEIVNDEAQKIAHIVSDATLKKLKILNGPDATRELSLCQICKYRN